MIDSGLVGEVSRGEKMLYSGTDPKSYITEYTLVYEDNFLRERYQLIRLRQSENTARHLA